ncbi:MAG: hypothetical protein AAF311_07305 [Pseudomonadota bacterium]
MKMLVKTLSGLGACALLAACGGMPDYGHYPAPGGYPAPGQPAFTGGPTYVGGQSAYATPVPRGFPSDRVTYSQKDPRWARDRLGRGGGTLAAEGCVVTSAAMAMTNSGFPIDPGELNRRLTASDNLTHSGLLKWKGVSEVSGGRVKATFHSSVSEPLIQSCLAAGDYPLVRFFLPNGRSHWAMILGRSERGYHMRDPLRVSDKPLIFPQDSSAFKSLRCIGPA